MPKNGLAIRHDLASPIYFGFGRQSFRARGSNPCFQAVVDERIVSAERRRRKGLSSCADSHTAGHGGRARATGVPRKSWLRKSRAERPCCQQIREPPAIGTHHANVASA